MDAMASEVPTAGAQQDLRRRVAELERELTEALEQQTATADVLKVISRSALDLQRVLDALVESAARLCNAYDAAILQVFGDDLRLVAHHGQIPTIRPVGQLTLPLVRGLLSGRAVIDRRTIQVADILAEADEYPENRRFATGRWRTALAVPLVHAGEAVGVILMRRAEVRPFTERQIELVTTFADQAVIAIENTRLFEAEQASKRELQETLEYQTATSEVLNVISRSPTELQPVLDAIARSSQRLCEADRSSVWRLVDRAFELAAISDHSRAVADYLARAPVPADRTSTAGRCVLEKRTLHIHDRLNEPGLPPLPQSYASGARTLLCVPLLREGEPIGVVRLSRDKVAPFTPRQIALVETFADQAVIAIENTRLFEAEQARTLDLTESLERQTATADVLKVISRSAFDLQRVLDTLVESAARLCEAESAQIFRPSEAGYRLAASYGYSSEFKEYVNKLRLAPGRSSVTGRVLLEGKAVQIPDVLSDSEYTILEAQRLGGFRTHLGVPLLREGNPIGVIVLSRRTAQPFDNKHVELVTTFADQAVIAIENTRLFEAEQAGKRELQESLEYQTATAEVLGVISRSPTDVQPVFDAIASSAAKLCNAFDAAVLRLERDVLRFAAHHGSIPISEVPLHRGTVGGRAFIERRPIHVEDLQAEEGEYPEGSAFAKRLGHRTTLGVPLLREGAAIGTILVRRDEVRPFSDKQIALLQVFADQAVIAIENARLFEAEQAGKRELQESLEYQTATSDVLNVISRSKFDLQPVLNTLVESAARLCKAEQTAIFLRDGNVYRIAARHGLPPELEEFAKQHPISPGRNTLTGRVALESTVVHIPDALADPEYAYGAQPLGSYRAMLGVPLLREGTCIGVLTITGRTPRPFTTKQIELAETFADQAVIAIENTRLFEEVQARTRELAKTIEDLEIASQHKNQFVANMSHELRTPLAAILGYAELMQEGFYEPLGQKSLDALTRIRSNGKHLLGLINTVLDIAKIESGQFTLNMAEYAIESVVETVRAATESLAQNKKLSLKTEVSKTLPVGLGDEQRLTQVLLNLVGNALKFTDTGEVRVTAKAINGNFHVSVADTGPGIPAEHQGRIFEQFHQVDSSNTKAKGGTGLGLAIAKQIVEMHGGRIWVESTLDKGSTFQMELPIRAEYEKRAP
jgi:signal transduction histidine kinase/ssDNA-specific exonuclease RecJ